MPRNQHRPRLLSWLLDTRRAFTLYSAAGWTLIFPPLNWLAWTGCNQNHEWSTILIDQVLRPSAGGELYYPSFCLDILIIRQRWALLNDESRPQHALSWSRPATMTFHPLSPRGMHKKRTRGRRESYCATGIPEILPVSTVFRNRGTARNSKLTTAPSPSL